MRCLPIVDAFPDTFRSHTTCVSGGRANTLGFDRGHASGDSGAVLALARSEAFSRLSILALLLLTSRARIVITAFIWHIFVVAVMPPGLPAPRIQFFAAAMNIAPVIGLFLLCSRVDRLATLLIVLPMAVMLVIGVYEHFLNSGPGNVFNLPASEWALSFRVSAVLLVVLEALGCWIGARVWSLQKHKPISSH
jgi:hypothetical protein